MSSRPKRAAAAAVRFEEDFDDENDTLMQEDEHEVRRPKSKARSQQQQQVHVNQYSIPEVDPYLSSYESLQNVTEDRDDKLLELKKRLCWSICHHLAPRPYDIADEDEVDDGMKIVLGDIDSGKTSSGTNSIMSAERALQTQKRELEMLRELERIMQRLREARSEYGKADEALKGTNAKQAEAQRFVCKKCGNRDAELIFTDPRTGDTICRGSKGFNDCGEVVQDHFIFAGEAHRNFEDQEDRNHHGPKQDSLMPDSVNMRTSFGGPQDAGQSKFKKLQQIAMQTEMDLSNIGKEGRAATRIGYKTNQKFKAFRLMSDLAVSLRIHELVVERAKLEFSRYREVRESIQQFEGTVVACLVISYQDLSQEMNLDIKYSDHVSTRDLGPALSYTQILHSSTGKDDDALQTLPSKRLKDMDQAEIRTWLLAVGGKEHESAALILADYVDRAFSGEEKLGSEANASKKRKAVDVSIFMDYSYKSRGIHGQQKSAAGAGTAPMRSVLPMIEPKLAAILASQSDGAAPVLSKPSAAKENNSKNANSLSAEDIFRTAILRRSRFDVAQRSARELEEAEAKRKKVEKADLSQLGGIRTSSALIEDDVLPSSLPQRAGSKTSSSVQAESKAPDAAPSIEAEFDIDELFGGSASSSFHFGKIASAPQAQGAPQPDPQAPQHPEIKQERIKIIVS